MSPSAGGSPVLSDTPVTALEAADFDGVRQSTLNALADDAAEAFTYLDAPVSHAVRGQRRHNRRSRHRRLRHASLRRWRWGGRRGATVRAYVASDYDAGLYVERGRTATRDDGRWVNPLYLDAGVTYAFTFSKPGVYQVSRQDVAV